MGLRNLESPGFVRTVVVGGRVAIGCVAVAVLGGVEAQIMNLFGRLLVGTFWLLAEAAAAPQASPGQPRLYNPYERLKNGPPRTNVFHKIEPS